MIKLVLAIAFISQLAGSSSVDEKVEQKQLAERRFAELTQLVSQYSIRPNADPEASFELVDRPILQWSNPVRQTESAAGVFLWTHQGRPAAVLCTIWADWLGPNTYEHEFQSLYDEPFVMELFGEPAWTPTDSGIRFEFLTDGPSVAKDPKMRLVQMRQITRTMEGSLGTVEKPTEALRWLTQPIYRYPERVEAPGVIDGAVFALAMGTDPEILLLIEARNDPSKGEPAWHIAFARMGHTSHVKRGEKVLWSCVRTGTARITDTYYWIDFRSNGLTGRPSILFKP